MTKEWLIIALSLLMAFHCGIAKDNPPKEASTTIAVPGNEVGGGNDIILEMKLYSTEFIYTLDNLKGATLRERQKYITDEQLTMMRNNLEGIPKRIPTVFVQGSLKDDNGLPAVVTVEKRNLDEKGNKFEIVRVTFDELHWPIKPMRIRKGRTFHELCRLGGVQDDNYEASSQPFFIKLLGYQQENDSDPFVLEEAEILWKVVPGLYLSQEAKYEIAHMNERSELLWGFPTPVQLRNARKKLIAHLDNLISSGFYDVGDASEDPIEVGIWTSIEQKELIFKSDGRNKDGHGYINLREPNCKPKWEATAIYDDDKHLRVPKPCDHSTHGLILIAKRKPIVASSVTGRFLEITRCRVEQNEVCLNRFGGAYIPWMKIVVGASTQSSLPYPRYLDFVRAEEMRKADGVSGWREPLKKELQLLGSGGFAVKYLELPDGHSGYFSKAELGGNGGFWRAGFLGKIDLRTGNEIQTARMYGPYLDGSYRSTTSLINGGPSYEMRAHGLVVRGPVEDK